jgi:hypothetical protein
MHPFLQNAATPYSMRNHGIFPRSASLPDANRRLALLRLEASTPPPSSLRCVFSHPSPARRCWRLHHCLRASATASVPPPVGLHPPRRSASRRHKRPRGRRGGAPRRRGGEVAAAGGHPCGRLQRRAASVAATRMMTTPRPPPPSLPIAPEHGRWWWPRG